MVAYPVALRRDDNGTYLVTSRDLDELATFGKDKEDAARKAERAIIAAVAARIRHGRDIPPPSAPRRGEALVALPTLLSAKMAVYLAMRAKRVSQNRLAKELGMDARQVRRMLDPTVSTHFDDLDRALRALGKQLKIEIVDRQLAA